MIKIFVSGRYSCSWSQILEETRDLISCRDFKKYCSQDWLSTKTGSFTTLYQSVLRDLPSRFETSCPGWSASGGEEIDNLQTGDPEKKSLQAFSAHVPY